MIIEDTQIIGVISNHYNVTILVRRAGTDSELAPEEILVVPQSNGIIVRFLKHFKTILDSEKIYGGDIQVNIPFKKL